MSLRSSAERESMWFQQGTARTCNVPFPRNYRVCYRWWCDREELYPVAWLRLRYHAFHTFLRASSNTVAYRSFWIKFQYATRYLYAQLIASFFSAVAERPVAQHLKHGMVDRYRDLLFQESLCFPLHTQAFFRVDHTFVFLQDGFQNNVLNWFILFAFLVKSTGSSLDDHRCRWYNWCPFLTSRILQRVVDLRLSTHNVYNVL